MRYGEAAGRRWCRGRVGARCARTVKEGVPGVGTSGVGGVVSVVAAGRQQGSMKQGCRGNGCRLVAARLKERSGGAGGAGRAVVEAPVGGVHGAAMGERSARGDEGLGGQGKEEPRWRLLAWAPALLATDNSWRSLSELLHSRSCCPGCLASTGMTPMGSSRALASSACSTCSPCLSIRLRSIPAFAAYHVPCATTSLVAARRAAFARPRPIHVPHLPTPAGGRMIHVREDREDREVKGGSHSGGGYGGGAPAAPAFSMGAHPAAYHGGSGYGRGASAPAPAAGGCSRYVAYCM